MNNLNQLSTKKIITIGTIVLFVTILGFVGYTQLTISRDMTNSGQYLKGEFFDKLKKIKDEKINFSNITKNMDATFHILTDTRDNVPSLGQTGRGNPFLR